MKKIYMIILIYLSVLLIPFNVNAEEFINKNNVSLRDYEISILSNIFWDDYYMYISQEEYDELSIEGFFDNEIITDEFIEYLTPIRFLDFSHETQYKRLIIASSCSNNCNIYLTLEWKILPTIRSYDVIGARLVNTSLIENPQTKIYFNNNQYMTTITDTYKSGGFGTSFKIPTGGSNLKIIQKFVVSRNGHVYASYQHAKRTSTLNKSKDFTISGSGYGSVFNFSHNSASYYDGMGGVDIEI